MSNSTKITVCNIIRVLRSERCKKTYYVNINGKRIMSYIIYSPRVYNYLGNLIIDETQKIKNNRSVSY